MPRGGRRPGAGAKPKPKPDPALIATVNKKMAEAILALTEKPHSSRNCHCEYCRWWVLVTSKDARLRFEVLKYLTDKRDGKAVTTVNHLHDKPIEHTHTFVLSATIQEARKRAAQLGSALDRIEQAALPIAPMLGTDNA